ncbi:SDR family NAD(P)-dependent oxidoreductase [Amycolatopsis lurida]
MNELAAELRATGAAVEVLPADLATPGGLARVSERLATGDVRLLISNAGAGGFARLADVDRLLTLNAVAPARLAHAALPGMLAANEGAIVTVASLLAFSAQVTDERIPPRALYTAAKAATVAFTRTLAAELAGTSVQMQVVCPGIVATEFDGGYGIGVPTAMSAEDVAAASLSGLRLGETVCLPGLEDLTALDALTGAETALLSGNRPAPAARYTLGPVG